MKINVKLDSSLNSMTSKISSIRRKLETAYQKGCVINTIREIYQTFLDLEEADIKLTDPDDVKHHEIEVATSRICDFLVEKDDWNLLATILRDPDIPITLASHLYHRTQYYTSDLTQDLSAEDIELSQAWHNCLVRVDVRILADCEWRASARYLRNDTVSAYNQYLLEIFEYHLQCFPQLATLVTRLRDFPLEGDYVDLSRLYQQWRTEVSGEQK